MNSFMNYKEYEYSNHLPMKRKPEYILKRLVAK